MDESQTVTNVQVSNHIPDDITISILSKLPLKSFKRFECVRKSWSLLFDDPYFVTIYRNNFLSKNCSYYDDTCLFVGLTEDGYEYNPSRGSNLIGLYSLSGENFENIVKIDWPKPFEDEDLDMDSDWDWDSDSSVDEDDTIFRIMDLTSVNGILCLSTFHHGNWRLILWSPITNEFKVIPLSYFEPHFSRGSVTPLYHLVGYDRIKDDYKVIRFNNDYDDSDDDDDSNDNDNYDTSLDSFWEIYSLSSNRWREMYANMPLFSRHKNVYMDGVSHWWDKNKTHTYLVSFDFCNESFTTTPMPSYIDDDSFEVNRDSMILRDLVILNGSIAFILNYKKTSTIHISVLGKLGVKESWTKLFIVGPSSSLNYPIVAAKKGKILFRSRSKKRLVWFDLSTGMIDKFDDTKKRYLSSI
jgi:molecular chaperone HtpG